MTSEFQDRLILALTKRNLACPDLKVEERKTSVRFSMPRNEASARYYGPQDYDTSYYTDLSYYEKDFDRAVRDIAKVVSAWRQTDEFCNKLSTVDAFMHISGQGVMEMPFEIDQILLTVLGRSGRNLTDLLENIFSHMDWNYTSRMNEVRDVAVSSFTNVDPLDMRRYFHRWHTRLNELPSRFRKVLPFQGCLLTKQTMSFDIRLAKGVHYHSSVSPAVTIRNLDLPETMIASLKGRPVNELLDEPMFSEHVVIKQALRNGKVINMTISQDRVDISHYGRQAQPLLKAA